MLSFFKRLLNHYELHKVKFILFGTLATGLLINECLYIYEAFVYMYSDNL